MRPKNYIPKDCVNCKQSYVPTSATQKYCSACMELRDSVPADDAIMVCVKCGKTKSIFEFSLRYKGQTRRHNECKDCKNEYRRIWVKTLDEKPSTKWVRHNREKAIERADRYMMKQMGLTLEEFKSINEQQKGLCAICKKPYVPRGRRRLVCDHDHKTGKFRGLLCYACNFGLGMFKDDSEILLAAMEYLGYADYARTFDAVGLGC